MRTPADSGRTADGTFTVPSYVLLSLPAQDGRLSLDSFSLSGTFAATGLDFGIVGADAYPEIQVQYR